MLLLLFPNTCNSLYMGTVPMLLPLKSTERSAKTFIFAQMFKSFVNKDIGNENDRNIYATNLKFY